MKQILMPITIAYFTFGAGLLAVWIQSAIHKDNTRSVLVNAQSAQLQVKRMKFCEQICLILAKSDSVIRDVWNITDGNDAYTDKEMKRKIDEVLQNETALKRLQELTPLCELYFSESLLKTFFGYKRAYNNLLEDPSHVNGIYGIDHSVDLHNDLRSEIGVEQLSMNIRQMFEQTAEIPPKERHTD